MKYTPGPSTPERRRSHHAVPPRRYDQFSPETVENGFGGQRPHAPVEAVRPFRERRFRHRDQPFHLAPEQLSAAGKKKFRNRSQKPDCADRHAPVGSRFQKPPVKGAGIRQPVPLRNAGRNRPHHFTGIKKPGRTGRMAAVLLRILPAPVAADRKLRPGEHLQKSPDRRVRPRLY